MSTRNFVPRSGSEGQIGTSTKPWGVVVADIGHFESEQFTKELIYDLLTKNFTKFAVRLSKVNTNPINYL